MTLSTEISRKVYSGNGSTTAFPTTFPFYDNGDLVVTLVSSAGVETVQTITTHYTVSGGSGANGTVTMLTAPASGESLVIQRDMPYVQEFDPSPGGDLPEANLEAAIDKAVMLIQQAKDIGSRAIQLPITTSLEDITIPEPGASELIRWNSGGTALESVALADLSLTLTTVLSGLADGDLLDYDSGSSSWVNLTKAALIQQAAPEVIKHALGLHGTLINTQYDLDATESNSEYTPGYAGGAEFYVRFINEAGTDATIDVHVDDGTTDLQIGDDLPIAANGGIILGPFIFTNVASISAAQTTGNVRMSINGVGYASGDYLTPLTNVEAINSTEETVFTTGSNGGAYKFLLGNNHTADLTGYILAGSNYLTAINHSVAVNDWWLSDLVKIDGSTALKAKTDTTANGFTLLSMGWEA